MIEEIKPKDTAEGLLKELLERTDERLASGHYVLPEIKDWYDRAKRLLETP